MQVNENLNDDQNINNIMKFKCTNCITTQLLKVTGGLFDSDSDDAKLKVDPLSDPMSDSFTDKNKLSKSEKSLQKPLHMF